RSSIQRGKQNKISIKLGHVLKVVNTNDSGSGSLRDAVADAKSGEVVAFNLRVPATITLTTGPIAISQSITIKGPGSSEVIVTAAGKSQLFTVHTGITA